MFVSLTDARKVLTALRYQNAGKKTAKECTKLIQEIEDDDDLEKDLEKIKDKDTRGLIEDIVAAFGFGEDVKVVEDDEIEDEDSDVEDEEEDEEDEEDEEEEEEETPRSKKPGKKTDKKTDDKASNNKGGVKGGKKKSGNKPEKAEKKSKEKVERDELGAKVGTRRNHINEVIISAKKPLTTREIMEESGENSAVSSYLTDLVNADKIKKITGGDAVRYALPAVAAKFKLADKEKKAKERDKKKAKSGKK